MQKFKIDYFEREHPGQQFPPTHSLSIDQSSKLLTEFAQNLANQSNIRDLVHFLITNCSVIEGADAESDQFDVFRLLHDFDVSPNQYVYLQWMDGLTTVEQIAYTDFSKYFEYIWYPGSDDILVFDDTFQWSLHVTHEGEVRLMNRKESQ